MTEKSTELKNNNQQDKSVWDNKKIVKRDFWLIPIYLLANNIMPLLLFAAIYIVYSVFNFKNEAFVTDENILIMGGLLAEIVILVSFMQCI